MLDKIKVLAPAKLNLFLKVTGKRKNGFHNIRSGITLINLFDVLEIKKSNKLKIRYSGPFKPVEDVYNDCILSKTLNFLSLNESICLDIKIEKNIPVQGGLGSASTNAAALIEGLSIMGLVKKERYQKYISLGSDIPCFLFKKNCLVLGVGDKIYQQTFPKYYFLIVKPKISNSTIDMYNKLDFKVESDLNNLSDYKVKKEDSGNDFEKIVFKENPDLRLMFEFLESLENVIFVRMTGSGSCFYAVFEKKEYANNAKAIFQANFRDLWTCIAENNTINN